MTFETQVSTWEAFKKGYTASDEELAELSLAAKTDTGAHKSTYSRAVRVLMDHASDRWEDEYPDGRERNKVIRAEVTRWKVTADLGTYPETYEELIPAWLKSRGYSMAFSGLWTCNGQDTQDADDHIIKCIKLWAIEIDAFKNMDAIGMAFTTWQNREKAAIQQRAFEDLRYRAEEDPDQSELKRFVRLVIDGGDDPERTWRAAEIALGTYMWRVKNHLRMKWRNSVHLMMILQGVQGDGKSEAIKHIVKPLGDCHTSGSLEALNDKSLSYQFSVMPSMLIEEMQGAAKADIEKLKALMTDDKRMMREAYQVAGVRRIVTTFIAASNKDIGNLIKDETGNRRLIQFASNRAIDRALIHQIDGVKIWRSINEDAAEPPQYESRENTQLIKDIQEGQRVIGPVEAWLLEECDPAMPWGKPAKAAKLFPHFLSWGEDRKGLSKAELPFWNALRLGATLRELAQTGRIEIKVTKTGGSDSFRITEPARETSPVVQQVRDHIRSLTRPNHLSVIEASPDRH